ncbi:uncharacterized protein [Lepeophtheirus salmonis]|nr:uncharacterized protein LOC121126066 [Lepeophtheirus salmonis]
MSVEGTMTNWSIGDLCVAVYSEDSLGYTAKINDISEDDAGSKYAIVEFVGYGNLETVWLADLKPPIIPETEFSKGAFARALSPEDGLEHEVEILEMNGTEVIIQYLGTGSTEVVQVENLLASRGEVAQEAERSRSLKKENLLMDSNNNESFDNNVTLRPVDVSTNALNDEKCNVTLHPVDLDLSDDVKDSTLHPCEISIGTSKVAREIDSKLALIESFEEVKAAYSALELKHSKLESNYSLLLKTYDEECIKLSECEDEKKVLRGEVEKAKSLYTSENLELKKRLKDMDLLQSEWAAEKRKLENRTLTLSCEINKLSHTADETVVTYKERIQQLEFEINEVRLSSKECANTSEGNESKNALSSQNNNSLNTTINLDRDDSVTYMNSPIRGNHPIIPLSLETERNCARLLNGGPVTMGQFQLQPVICYFPILGGSTLGPQAYNTVNLNPSLNTPAAIPEATPFDTPKTNTESRILRRPMASTEFQSKYPISSGRLRSISKDESGSVALIKEIEDSETTKSRINDIYGELKDCLSEVSNDRWGYKVVISLLLVSPSVLCHSIIQQIWEDFHSYMKSSYGIFVILNTMNKMSYFDGDASLVEKVILNYGILDLMLHQEGYRIIMSIIDHFKPNYILESVNKNVIKLSLNEQGGQVLAKAIASYSHNQISVGMNQVISSYILIEKDAPRGISIFESILENHVKEGILKDDCVRQLATSLSPNFKIILKKFLDTTPLGSSWFNSTTN